MAVGAPTPCPSASRTTIQISGTHELTYSYFRILYIVVRESLYSQKKKNVFVYSYAMGSNNGKIIEVLGENYLACDWLEEVCT